ncbi:MAG: hypothetical protein HOK02_08040 [Halieaceae bacterium]|nr:hypothetical protein [Halieaceae bacterium]
MRGLAEFIMRGRWQALGVAVLGSGSLLFGWVSAAAIALVTLRNGSASGGWLTLWAILPAMIIAAISGDTGSVLLLLGTFSLAVILRESVSLSLAVMASVPLALLGGAALTLFNGVFLQELVATFNQALAQLEQELAQGEAAEMVFNAVSVPQVAALLATGNAVIALLSLILGRYWQASLYNPGGFGEEFRALRLPVGAVLMMASAALILWWMGADWRVWSAVVVLPLTIVGFSLLHACAKRAGKGVTWLALMYSLWIVLDPVKWLWVGCVVIDTFADVRGRWSRSAGQGSDGD